MRKSGGPSIIIDILVAKVLQETQDLVHENEYGTCSVNKTARRLELSIFELRQIKLNSYMM